MKRCEKHHRDYNMLIGCPECDEEFLILKEKYKLSSNANLIDFIDNLIREVKYYKGQVCHDPTTPIEQDWQLDALKEMDEQEVFNCNEDSFAIVAKYWNTYLIEVQKKLLIVHGFKIEDYKLVDMLTSKDVAHMMDLFKIASAADNDKHEWIGGSSGCPHVRAIYDSAEGFTRCKGCGARRVSEEVQKEIKQALERR